ncbi:MAG: hypothetical protein ABR589_11570 [Chthoniobacterales bacterium]
MKRAVVILLLLIANAVFGSSESTAPNNGEGRIESRQPNGGFDLYTMRPLLIDVLP